MHPNPIDQKLVALLDDIHGRGWRDDQHDRLNPSGDRPEIRSNDSLDASSTGNTWGTVLRSFL
jgi:hypothetical protein